MITRHKKIGLLILLCFIYSLNIYAQSAVYETYGRYQLQKDLFEWKYLDTTNFRVFYYGYGKVNAQYLLQQSEIDLPKIADNIGINSRGKINIVLYNSFKDYIQTNIGHRLDQLKNAEGGKLDIAGNHVVIFFDGTHHGMRSQLREGVVTHLRDQVLYGTKLKDIIKKASSGNIPLWFSKGYVKYLSHDWTADDHNTIVSLLQSYPKARLEGLADEHNEIVGKSFFHFIDEQFGESYVNNLMHVANSGNGLYKTISKVLEMPFKEVEDEWRKFFWNLKDKDTISIPERKRIGFIKVPRQATINHFALSPDGKFLAYVVYKGNQYKVYLHEFSTEKNFSIIEGGVRLGLEMQDKSYPLIAWSQNAKKLAIMYELDHTQRIKVWDANKGRISERAYNRSKFERIHSMAFMEDDEKLLISALRRGQSDLYQFVIKGGQLAPVTKDLWDDITPSFIYNNNYNGAFFFSNRTKNYLGAKLPEGTLPNSEFKLWYYNAGTASDEIIDISQSSTASISQARQYGTKGACILAEQNGIKQRYLVHINNDEKGKESVRYTLNAPIPYNVVYHEYNRKENSMVDVILRNQVYEIYSTPIKFLDSIDQSIPPDTLTQLMKKEKQKTIDQSQPQSYFITEFDEDSTEIKEPIEVKQTPSIRKFRPKNYGNSFSLDYMQYSFDNSLIFNSYQRLDPSNAPFNMPPIGAMVNFGLVDVFEDYHITGAIRPNGNNTFSYIARFANMRKRLDWEIYFAHNADTILRNNSGLDTNHIFYSPYREERGVSSQNLLMSQLVLPMNAWKSFKFTNGIRNDRTLYKATTDYSLRFPVSNEFWWMSRAEFVYDNTTNPITNIHKGLRYKIWTEGLVQMKRGGGSLYTYGGDLRYYAPIFKNIILANRLCLGASGGKTRMIYRMGGIDNDINFFNTNYSNQLLQKDSTEYGYQTIATNLRGYKQNDLNGSSFLVLNEEIRIPLWNTISRRRVKSKMLNTLQFVGFADLGSTGLGFFPGGYKFDYNTSPTVNNGATIAIQKQYESTLVGYGMGVRTTLLGYYIRTDLAWGQISRVPRLHISLAHDF